MSAQLKFRVNNLVVHQVLEERFGGIANFADEWLKGKQDGHDPGTAQRSVKTIYAWLKHGLPTTKDTLFSFFGALGLDPIAALDFDRPDYRRSFGRLRRAFMLGGISSRGFRPLFDLYRPSVGWPDQGLSQTYYNRDWTVFDFEHPATKNMNTYATITVQASDSFPANWPRAFHIAYRRCCNADGLWRPYGTVLSRFGESILAHENGDLQRAPIKMRSQHRLGFQTYFGPSPVQFRLVSLHPFNGQVEPAPDPDAPLHFVG